VVSLSAGPLSLGFLDGGLRRIRLGAREVLQRVYVAVPRSEMGDPSQPESRACNWGRRSRLSHHLERAKRESRHRL